MIEQSTLGTSKSAVIGILAIAALLPDSVVAETRLSRASTQLYVLEMAIDRFQKQHSRIPTQVEGLDILAIESDDWEPTIRWTPKVEPEALLDQWGNRWIYEVNREYKDGYRLYSMGADGASASQGDDPDDVNSWSSMNDGSFYLRNDRLSDWLREPVIMGLVALAFASIAIGFLSKRASNKVSKGAG